MACFARGHIDGADTLEQRHKASYGEGGGNICMDGRLQNNNNTWAVCTMNEWMNERMLI